jgi:hypothetical protein
VYSVIEIVCREDFAEYPLCHFGRHGDPIDREAMVFWDIKHPSTKDKYTFTNLVIRGKKNVR